MRRIFSFTLAVIMVISVSVLCGCSNNSDNTATSGNTPYESPLAGHWTVIATDDEIQWDMNSQNTLHITETRSGQRYTTVCNYSYDEDTGAFEYTCLSAKGGFEGIAKLEGNKLTIVSNDGLTSVKLTRLIQENQ